MKLLAEAGKLHRVKTHQARQVRADIEGDMITLRLRNAKTISVDLSEALHDSKSVVPVVGSAVVVTGKFSASGTLHALQMLRAKSSEQLWDMDIGPQ